MRVILLIAVVIAFLAISYGFIATGRLLERAANKRNSARIDPQTYEEMANLIRLVFGAQPVDDPAYIPQWMKDEGQPVLRKIGTARRAVPPSDGPVWRLPS
jgi:hypothetical protein